MSRNARTTIIRSAAVGMFLLAVAAALLPLTSDLPERVTTGTLLVLAGVLEMGAVFARRGRNLCAGIAAAATLIAGFRLALDPGANFFTIFNMVIMWLVVRSAALGLSARGSPPPACHWVYGAAGVDFLLALLLLIGLPMTVLIVGIFGPTPEVIATFSWIFAASFVATAASLLAVANERDQEPG